MTQGENGDSRESRPSLPPYQVAPVESNVGGRSDGSIKEARKDAERCAELKTWCSVWKKKGNIMIPSKAKEARAYTTMLKDQEPLTTN